MTKDECHKYYLHYDEKNDDCVPCATDELLDLNSNTCISLIGMSEEQLQELLSHDTYKHLRGESDLFKSVRRHNCHVRRKRYNSKKNTCHECTADEIFNPITGGCMKCTSLKSNNVKKFINHHYGYPHLSPENYLTGKTFTETGRVTVA